MKTRFRLHPFSITAIFLLLSIMAANGQKPNVLFIVSDDLNTRIGPFMDIEQHTPNLDRLANEGIKFTRTYCQYPICGPSRASFMSGLYPESNGILGNSGTLGSYRAVTPALANHPSMAGYFREQGYYTARVSKIYHMGVPGGIERGDPGGDDPDSWDFYSNIMGPETLSQGKLELLSPGSLHYGANFSRMILPNDLEHTQTDYLAVSQAIAILENRAGPLPPNGTNKRKLKPDQPFFLGVGLVRPHVPLIAPERCFEPYPDDEMQLPEVVIGENVPEAALRHQNHKAWKMSEEEQKKVISGYMASVRFMDEQVGRLLDALDRLGIRDNTIIVFISDHGYNLGEHDCWSKISLWEGSVRVPMIISHPDFKQHHGATCESITELIDLYPTLTDLCGIAEEQPKILQGRSLADWITKDPTAKREAQAYTTTHGGKDASLRTNRWRYTRWGENAGTGKEELYDHENDPEELVNLVDRPEMQKVLEEMRQGFERIRERARGK